MRAYSIKYACKFILKICKTPSLNKKVDLHTYIISMLRITLNMHKMVLLQMVPFSSSVFSSSQICLQLKIRVMQIKLHKMHFHATLKLFKNT